jgi:hypothetical protein
MQEKPAFFPKIPAFILFSKMFFVSQKTPFIYIIISQIKKLRHFCDFQQPLSQTKYTHISIIQPTVLQPHTHLHTFSPRKIIKILKKNIDVSEIFYIFAEIKLLYYEKIINAAGCSHFNGIDTRARSNGIYGNIRIESQPE